MDGLSSFFYFQNDKIQFCSKNNFILKKNIKNINSRENILFYSKNKQIHKFDNFILNQ